MLDVHVDLDVMLHLVKLWEEVQNMTGPKKQGQHMAEMFHAFQMIQMSCH